MSIHEKRIEWSFALPMGNALKKMAAITRIAFCYRVAFPSVYRYFSSGSNVTQLYIAT
jgi:hypothetical protein